jgi:hypothetical protein
MIFAGQYLLIGRNTLVALKYVESMSYFIPGDMDNTFNVLKNDRVFKIGTISGKEYTVSVKDQFQHIPDIPTQEFLSSCESAIFDKWMRILKEDLT